MKNVITYFSEDSLFGTAALAHAQKLSQILDADINEISLNEKTDLHAVFDAAEEGNTLCFVMPVAPATKDSFFNTKKAKKWIRKSRVPVVVVGNNEPEENDYQQIILPLDSNCKEKELALWASYFPAYFQKNCPQIPKEKVIIHILFNTYKNELLQKKVENNVDFVTNMFNNLEAPYTLHPQKNIDNIYTFGLQFAKSAPNSVLLMLMTEHYSLVDLLFGPVESKIIRNKEQIPVLCLNAREDSFVLCQ